jgi:hypothetical protein
MIISNHGYTAVMIIDFSRENPISKNQCWVKSSYSPLNGRRLRGNGASDKLAFVNKVMIPVFKNEEIKRTIKTPAVKRL